MNTIEIIEIRSLVEAIRQKKVTVIQIGNGKWIPADEIKKVILPDGTVEMI